MLARAYQRVNRLGDAKRIIVEAQTQGKDSAELHQHLLEIAIIEQDQQAIQHEVQWGSDQSDLAIALDYRAFLAADAGHYRDAERLFSTAIRQAQQNDAEVTQDILLDEASAEVEFGRTAQAEKVLQRSKQQDDPRLIIIAAMAGNSSAAESYMQLPEKNPRDTVEHFLLRPELKAELALIHGDPISAISALESTRKFELSQPEVIEIRARAYLLAHQGALAQAEFQRLIDNPGWEDPEMPRTNLAHLGMARAYAIQGETDNSRTEYEKLFSLWKDADADIPVLRQAHLEYNQLH